VDNPYFANCKLIVKAKYCANKYYAKFCCRSCTLAGRVQNWNTENIKCLIFRSTSLCRREISSKVIALALNTVP